MKRVLVTGANGFLGKHTLHALEACGWEVVGVARSRSARASVATDLTDPLFPAVLQALERCDAIVHLAAKVDWAQETTPALYCTNVHATSSLVALAHAWGAKIAFASSATVCGTHAAHIDASTAAAPDTPYARSKWLGEALVTSGGIAATVLRFGGIFGPDGPPHLGLNRAIAGALTGDPPTITGTGRARRNYIYVKDAARAIAHALDQDVLGTHLVAGSETLSIAQWIAETCRALLPGAAPASMPGPDAADQVIVPSEALPRTRNVGAAMLDMRPGAR